jgi:type III restriction enzyme
MTKQTSQYQMQTKINTYDWTMPREYEMPVDDGIKRFVPYDKNVYDGYLSSAGRRSDLEKRFEKWCNDHAVWFYKNGEHNQQFLSIIYVNNAGKQKVFYPDYILEDHTFFQDYVRA